MKFEDLELSKEFLSAIQKLGFAEPTQIQELSLPHIMNGEDVIGESSTGSGKTLAFGGGIIEKVVPGQGVQGLILTPTRELAEQIKNFLRELTFDMKMKIITVYGGVSIEPQIHGLTKADVVVATPGRLLDHLQRGTIDTSNVKVLVLDEADRMLDMGFIEDVERIIQACPKERQTLFFSATLETKIKNLAKRYMHNPIKVSAKTFVDPSKLKQVYYDVSKNMKLSLLIHLLKKETKDLAMVFCNTRRNTDFVVKNLKINNVNAIAIHGGFSQNKRTSTIKMFDKSLKGVLVCTDVAARGLHIDNVSHIYNYDIPKDAKDYVHRIGRTARAGEEGMVINLLCDFDYENFGRLQYEYPDFKIEKLETPKTERIQMVRTEERRSFSGRRSFGHNRPQGGRPFNRSSGSSRHRSSGGKRFSGR